MQSVPPYSHKHSGPVIVAGSARCLHDDLACAREIYGNPPIIAVNGASREVKAFALYSGHPERFAELRWAHHQQRLFGGDFSVHSGFSGVGEDCLANVQSARVECPLVQYWWAGTGRASGTSAWAARKMAAFMGFNLVLLCGCPLDPGPYVGHRLGHELMLKESVIDRYRAVIRAETEWHEGCLSLSGTTARILGSP